MEEDAQYTCVYFRPLSIPSGGIFLHEVRKMKELRTNVVNNLSFIGVCVLVIAALGVAARVVEL